MTQFRTIKGTHDILPIDTKLWLKIASEVREIMFQYGYAEIRTPAIENTELFIRGIGLDTDIVNKEMFSWTDQGGKALTLKPELTAPVARAYIQHQLGSNNPMHRLCYFDSLFRRERPQKGRQRQFYQFGAEAIGSPHSEQDAEIIAMAFNIYKYYNIKDISIRINSIGSAKERPSYLKLLRDSIANMIQEFCNTCQSRMKNNALRMFDCKNNNCQILLEDNAPYIYDSISTDNRKHFELVLKLLDKMKIPYSHDKKLVRGLDYYSHTTFEITSSSLGAQNALCGGGRYNGLIEKIGGKSTPAVGFAAGFERLLMQINKEKHLDYSPDIYIVTIGTSGSIEASLIAEKLRTECNQTVVIETLRRSMKAQMREANRCSAKYVIILGESELSEKKVVVKKMDSGDQKLIPLDKIINFFS